MDMKPLITLILAAFAIVAIIGGCTNDKARREAANDLVDQARRLSEDHQYDSALVVLDTLDVKYRDCLDERREGTRLRLATLASMTRDSIAADELKLRSVMAEIDSLSPDFKKIKIAGTEGYYVDRQVYSGSEMNSTGIQVRVDDQGYCFVVANVAGRQIGLNRIVYGDTATSPVESVKVEGSEIMSVTQESAAPLLEALSKADGKATVTLSGTKGKTDISLSAGQLKSIRSTWNYARALQQKRELSIRLEKLERQLAKLSDQLALQTPVEEE